MKLVAIARVKNETDIIEAFVRHHARHFDKLIVLDDGSSDGTFGILQKLQKAVADLVILNQPTIGYRQQHYMSLLLQMSVDKFGADWIAPLDADEFIETAVGRTLAEVLAHRAPALFQLHWSNFVWSPEQERSRERNPVVRQRFRMPPRTDQTKLLIHATFVNRFSELALGSHSLMFGGLPVTSQPLEDVKLCHFPVRSIAQYASKVAVGHLQYLATPDWNQQDGFHYVGPFHDLAEGGLNGLEQRMKQDSEYFGSEEMDKTGDGSPPFEEALNYLGGPLEFTPFSGSVLTNVLHHAQMLARETAAHERELLALNLVSTEAIFLRQRVAALELELLSSQERGVRQLRRLQSRSYRIITAIHAALLNAKRQAKRIAYVFSSAAYNAIRNAR